MLWEVIRERRQRSDRCAIFGEHIRWWQMLHRYRLRVTFKYTVMQRLDGVAGGSDSWIMRVAEVCHPIHPLRSLPSVVQQGVLLFLTSYESGLRKTLLRLKVSMVKAGDTEVGSGLIS